MATFLKRYSPAYADIEISANNLAQLPEDGYVTNDLREVVLNDDNTVMRGEGNQGLNGPDSSGASGDVDDRNSDNVREEYLMRDPQAPANNDDTNIQNHLNGSTPEIP